MWNWCFPVNYSAYGLGNQKIEKCSNEGTKQTHFRTNVESNLSNNKPPLSSFVLWYKVGHSLAATHLKNNNAANQTTFQRNAIFVANPVFKNQKSFNKNVQLYYVCKPSIM